MRAVKFWCTDFPLSFLALGNFTNTIIPELTQSYCSLNTTSGGWFGGGIDHFCATQGGNGFIHSPPSSPLHIYIIRYLWTTWGHESSHERWPLDIHVPSSFPNIVIPSQTPRAAASSSRVYI